jgi:8-oxo-dGTP pyrophosphatase MutT (NUDIX family)
VKEETGFQIAEPVYLFSAFATPGAKTEKIHFFTAQVDLDQNNDGGGGMEAEQEDIEVIVMPFEEAWEKMKNGRIRDLKTITLLLHARMEIFLLPS